MKYIILLLLISISVVSFGQKESLLSKKNTDTFILHYNKDNYKSIYEMFSEKMKEALPLDKTETFLKSIKSQAGNISQREFIKYKNGTYALYKTTFERTVLSLNISVNKNSEIDGLLIKPYKKDKANTSATNDLSYGENSITKEQAEIIYEKTKFFPKQTQLAIAIIKKGKVQYYGVKRITNSLRTVENHKSIFEIGSITKVFTATLLAGFVVDNKVKLNDHINDYIKVPVKNKTQLSFKDLINHTSGLPRLPPNLDLSKNSANPYKTYYESDLETYLTKSLKLTKKGTYQYSNLGAGLIGYILGKIEGLSFEQLLQNKIFSKYGMSSSTTSQSKVKGTFVIGLDAKGNKVSNWDFSVLSGAGGILSHVEDLSKFAVAQFNSSHKELELTRQKTFDINNKLSIGLGWHILSQNNWIWHNGGTGGYSSSMTLDIQNKNGIIILSNVSAFNPKAGNIDQLGFALMKTLAE